VRLKLTVKCRVAGKAPPALETEFRNSRHNSVTLNAAIGSNCLARAGRVSDLAIRRGNDVMDIGKWGEIELSDIGVGNEIMEERPAR
jgi:hypothetical protein